MKTRDLARLVVHNLQRMRARVTMTALGVVIGTAAVVVLVSLGAGLQRKTQESLLAGGALTELHITPPVNFQAAGAPSGASPGASEDFRYQVLDDRVLTEIRALPGVGAAVPQEVLMAQTKVAYEQLEGYPTLVGIEPPDLARLEVPLDRGTLDLRRGQVIVGALVAERSLRDPDTFNPYREVPQPERAGAPDLLGETLWLHVTRIAGDGTKLEKTVRVEVVGVLAPVGWRHDFTIYLPFRDVIASNTWADGTRRDPGRQGYAQVTVKATSIQHTLEVEETLNEMGFPAMSQRQQVEEANAYFATVQAVLAGIGGVALLVAAFGIANTMLMSIYERTREIGLMKAIGASHRDVMAIFLAESASIGLLGGFGGVGLGAVVNVVINVIAGAISAEQAPAGAIAQGRTTAAYLPLWLPLFAIVFATCVGVASGAYPARRAANLPPLGALKYE